jgi:hypothetical protein
LGISRILGKATNKINTNPHALLKDATQKAQRRQWSIQGNSAAISKERHTPSRREQAPYCPGNYRWEVMDREASAKLVLRALHSTG